MRSLGLTFGLLAFLLPSAGSSGLAGDKQEKLLSHDVFFSLHDNSAKSKQTLVDACKKYLSGHEGEVFFSVGTLVESLDRPVNDRDFDVALHIVFKDLAAHDKYQDHPRHVQFINEHKASWKKVRVFDSYVLR